MPCVIDLIWRGLCKNWVAKMHAFGFNNMLSTASNANKWNLHVNKLAWEITLINGGVYLFCIFAPDRPANPPPWKRLFTSAVCWAELFAFASLPIPTTLHHIHLGKKRAARLLVTRGEYYHSLGALDVRARVFYYYFAHSAWALIKKGLDIQPATFAAEARWEWSPAQLWLWLFSFAFSLQPIWNFSLLQDNLIGF